MKTINVVAGIIKKDNKIFIAERGYGEFKGMYEFPGGKIEPGEEPKDALKRELYEEMQAHIEVDSFFYHVHYEYSDFILVNLRIIGNFSNATIKTSTPCRNSSIKNHSRSNVTRRNIVC